MGCRSSKHGFSKVRVSETTRSGTNSVTSSSRKLFSRKIKSVTSWSSGQWNSSAVLSTPDAGTETVGSSSNELKFTDFCTTKATYSKFGSKTSTITVRLSSDGSTLQIEQCEMPSESSIQRSESAPCLGRGGKLEKTNINKTFTVAAQMTPLSLVGFSGLRQTSFSTDKTVDDRREVGEIGEMCCLNFNHEQEKKTKMHGDATQVSESNMEKISQCTCGEDCRFHVGINESTCLLEDKLLRNSHSLLQSNISIDMNTNSFKVHNKHVNQDLSNNNLKDGCTKLKYNVGKMLYCYKTALNGNVTDSNISYEHIPATDGDNYDTADTITSNMSYTDMLTNDLHDDQWSDCDFRKLYDCSNSSSLSISVSPKLQPRRLSVRGLYEDEFSNGEQDYAPSVGLIDVPPLNETKDLIMPDYDVPHVRQDLINVFFRF